MYLELSILALISMAAPVLAKLAGYEMGRKPFDLCAAGGIFFLLAAACGFGASVLPGLMAIGSALTWVAVLLGWASLAVGAGWAAFNVIREPDHVMVRQPV